MEVQGRAYQNMRTDGSSDNQEYPPLPSHIPETGTDAWKENIKILRTAMTKVQPFNTVTFIANTQ